MGSGSRRARVGGHGGNVEMNGIKLSDFTGADDRERFCAALGYMKKNPGTTLTVEPGVYRITTDRARAAQRSVMTGEWGEMAQDVMFSPSYRYDRILDFDGHENSTVLAYGATLLIDGFMEGISIRNCRGVTVRGFTLDHVRKPYTKFTVRETAEEDGFPTVLAECADEIFEGTPLIRTAVFSQAAGRFIPDRARICEKKIISPHGVKIKFEYGADVREGDEIYSCHVFHTRPGVLIQSAADTLVEDVTVHSWPGMGLTAQSGRDITVRGLRVVPSEGERMSTNTDATHFSACRGKLLVEGCSFEGQGDDSINVHTYYYTPVKRDGNTLSLVIKAPDGTHTQALLCPEVGDRFELTETASLLPVDTFRVTASVPDPENRCCHVTLDRALPESLDGYFFADPDEVPDVIYRNNKAKNHFARSILIKSRTALIEDCAVEDCFEEAVKIAAEAGWHEGINSESVTVRNCRFTGCGRRSYVGCGGVAVYMDTEAGKPAHGEVLIENVTVDCPDVPHGIILRDVGRAVVRGCKIRSAEEPVAVGDGVKAEID